MKPFNFLRFLTCLFIYCITALTTTAQSAPNAKQDSLAIYTGKYQMTQGAQNVYAEVYIDKGALVAKSADGQLLMLDRVNGDNFMISGQHVPVKFIRDKDNRIAEVSVNGSTAWTKVETRPEPAANNNPFNPADYFGKYQVKVNGQSMIIEVSLKNNELWATQLWDGGNSALDFKSADNFIVNALSMPLRFVRNKDNKVTQLVLNNRDVFTKVN